jgi:hypothetical protein
MPEKIEFQAKIVDGKSAGDDTHRLKNESKITYEGKRVIADFLTW